MPAIVFAADLDTVFGAEQPIEIAEDPERGGSSPRASETTRSAWPPCRPGPPVRGPPAGRRAARPLVLAATVGEEGLGDLRGQALVATIPCGAFIAVEGQLLDAIKIRGSARPGTGSTYRGPGGHSWTDRGTASAVTASCPASRRSCADRRSRRQHEHRPDPGGTSINTIAAEAAIELDLRWRTRPRWPGVAARRRRIFGTPRRTDSRPPCSRSASARAAAPGRATTAGRGGPEGAPRSGARAGTGGLLLDRRQRGLRAGHPGDHRRREHRRQRAPARRLHRHPADQQGPRALELLAAELTGTEGPDDKVDLEPYGIVGLVAPNPGPLTLSGTNSSIVGRDRPGWSTPDRRSRSTWRR